MTRDVDTEYDRLMDELEDAVAEEDPGDRGPRIRVIRHRIEALLTEQMGRTSLPLPNAVSSSSLN